MIKRIVFKNLRGRQGGGISISGIRFYGCDDALIESGAFDYGGYGSHEPNHVLSSPNFRIKSNAQSYNTSYVPAKAFDTRLLQIGYENSFYTSESMPLDITCEFKVGVKTITKIELCPIPDNDWSSVSEDFIIEIYNELDILVKTYSITPIKDVMMIQTVSLLDLYLSNYYLIKSETTIKKISELGILEDTNLIEPLVKLDFETHGFTDLSLITEQVLSTLDNSKLLMYSEKLKPTLNIKAIPKAQLIKPTDDIKFKLLDKINLMTLTSNKTRQGVVKIIFSVDSGVTWKTYNIVTLEFEDIDITNLENVKIYGINADTFNTINSKWNEVVKEGKIRFAYYLEIENEDDVANVDKLEINMDLTGRWKKAKHDTDYDYEYDNEHIYVTFQSDGSYKVNYME